MPIEIFEPQFLILILIALLTSGLTIYSVSQAKGSGKFLCQDCKFNNPKDCQKKERPVAFECTSYREKALPQKADKAGKVKK